MLEVSDCILLCGLVAEFLDNLLHFPLWNVPPNFHELVNPHTRGP